MICQGNSNVAYVVYFNKVSTISDIVPHHSAENFDEILYKFAYSFDNVTWSEWFETSGELVSHLSVNPTNFGNIYVKLEVRANKAPTLAYSYYKLNCVQVDGTDLTVNRMEFAKKSDILLYNKTKNLYQPYANTDNAHKLNKKLARSVSDIFSFETMYFRTEPQHENRMSTFKTFPLVDVVENKSLPIVINENQLPDSRYEFSEFDFDFQDELEIHIVVEVWREIFGDVEPNANDYLFLPLTNRMYQINTVHDAKEFMHKATYYRAMLVQFEDRADVIESEDFIEEREDYFESFDSFDEERIQDETDDAERLDLHEPNEPESTNSVSESSVDVNGMSVVDYLYNFEDKPNDVVATTYNITQTEDEFALSYWFKAPSSLKTTAIDQRTFISAEDDSFKRLLRVFMTNNEQISVEIELEANSTYNLTTPTVELTEGNMYGVLLNVAYNETGRFVTLSIFDESLNELSTKVDTAIPSRPKRIKSLQLRGGLQIGNIRLKKSIVTKSKMPVELSKKMPEPSKYYIADNAVPQLVDSSISNNTSCPTLPGSPVTKNPITTFEQIKLILAKCADPDHTIEEFTTAERDASNSTELSIIYNKDTNLYERLEAGIWKSYPITKEDVKAQAGW